MENFMLMRDVSQRDFKFIFDIKNKYLALNEIWLLRIVLLNKSIECNRNLIKH